MFIDTHAHLYTDEYDLDREAMIQRAVKAGLGRIYLPNVDVKTISALWQVRELAPAMMYPMMGLHPCSVREDYLNQLSVIEDVLQKGTYFGIGEMGLDLHWDPTTLPLQVEAFKIQCEWARTLDLPIIIHSREATDQVIDLLENMNPRPSKGVFHCFSGNMEHVNRINQLGEFYFGIGGVVTYKNSGLAALIPSLPFDKLVLETDAPYLSPVPFRGKRNESAHILYIAQKLAETLSVSLETIENQTTVNALRLFGKINPESAPILK